MCHEKMKIYSPVNSVTDVKILFGKLHKQLGFPRLVSLQDNNVIMFLHHLDLSRGKKSYMSGNIIFEYLSSDYLLKKYNHFYLVLVCWEDDCHLKSYLKNNYNQESKIERVIALQNYVEVIPDIVDYKSRNKNLYYLIDYDLVKENYKGYVDLLNTKLLKFKNNNNIKITDGSKALIKDGDYIIGGFDIVRHENIWIPNDRNFIESYKRLTDYPVGLVFLDCDEVIEKYANQNVNHIFYSNFFELNNKKLRKTIKEILPNFETSDCVVQALTEEEYNKLLGIDKKFCQRVMDI